MKRLRIALLVESSRSYSRNLLGGIVDYANTYGPWLFYHEERSLGDPVPSELKAWRPDGILMRTGNPQFAKRLRRLGVPMVEMFREEASLDVPFVVLDHKAIAELAVDHLVQCGMENLAYCGLPGVFFSDLRCRYFQEYAASKGRKVTVFAGGGHTSQKGLAAAEADALQHTRQLTAWLDSLPKPTGLMACHDIRAYQVLSVCSDLGIAVPDSLAVIGVDNDPVYCQLCDPPLSSVDPNAQRVGYEAAAMLHRMILGEKLASPTVLIEPAGVISRQSTNVLAISDREVVEVIRCLRENACAGLTVRSFVARTPYSRSTLERWFLKHLGHSINAEIVRVKIQRVKELLTTTDLPLQKIARLAGFSHSETMQRLFKKITGQTPGACRSDRQIT
jgi:LacI family transcriptional regulator